MKSRKFSRLAKEGQNLRREKKEKRRQKAAAATEAAKAARLARKARVETTPEPDTEETEQQQQLLNDENDLEFAPPDFNLFGDDDDRPIFEPLDLNIIDQDYDDQPTTSGTVQMEFGTKMGTI